MGLLGEIYSAGDSAKRKLKGLLSDPLGELGLLGARAAEDMQTFLDTGAKAYPMLDPRLKPRLDTPQGREMVVDQNVARRQFGDVAGNMGMAAATVWHGSPHKFDRFDSSKIGTGEGAQAYGHGLYLADSPKVAKQYADTLTDKAPKFLDGVPAEQLSTAQKSALGLLAEAGGNANAALLAAKTDMARANGAGAEFHVARYNTIRDIARGKSKAQVGEPSLYKVDLPDEAIAKMLDWDKPLSQQAPEVQRALAKVKPDQYHPSSSDYDPMELGQMIHQRLTNDDKFLGIQPGARMSGAPGWTSKIVTNRLREAGIPGIRYLDGGSRSAGTGTRNYVVFPGNEGLLTILERNGVAP